MATIRKRIQGKATRWVVDYLDQKGTRRLKTYRTRREADAALVEIRHQVSQGTHTADRASATVAEAAKLWLEHSAAEGLETSTLRQYRQHVDYHIVPLIGRERLSRLTVPRIKQFRDELLATRSRAMARKVLTSLKSILREAQGRGLIAQNCAQGVVIETRNRHKAPVAIPSKAEIRALLEAVQGRWRPLLIVAIFTGLRASELRGLTWADVDFDARRIRVTQRANLWGKLGVPKSASSRREVPLAPLALNTLREWRLACPKGDQDLVFPNSVGKLDSHSNIYNRGFAPAQVAAMVVDADGKAKYGLHALRHFFASWLIDQGFGPKRVQQLMGHSSVKLTLDTYTTLWPQEDDHDRFAAGELALVG